MRLLLNSAIVSLLLFSCQGKFDTEPRPNLLIIYPDQWRAQALGYMNEEPVQTPNLDHFASESLVLTQAVSNYPICSPTRASLMTGRYPAGHGVWSNCNSMSAPFGNELGADAVTWSDILKAKGYATGYIGKWHLDSPFEPYVNTSNNDGVENWNEWCPPERRHGFDYWYAYGTYDQHMRPMYWSQNAGREEFHYVNEWGPIHETNLAIDFINNKDNGFRQGDKPFALMVSMNPPHMPYEAVPDRYRDKYKDMPLELLTSRPNIPKEGTRWGDYYREKIKNYYAMMTGVDEQVGRLLGALDEAGLTDNTIVVFSSDHGNCLGIHNQISKDNHYEESMRVPLIIRWPEKIASRRDNLLFSTPDLYPTLLTLMGFQQDIPKEVEGRNYASYFQGEKIEKPKSQLYIHSDPGLVSQGRRGLRTGRYTLMVSAGEAGIDSTVLHDNVKDPYQLVNISASSAITVDSLMDELRYWLVETDDPFVKHLKN